MAISQLLPVRAQNYSKVTWYSISFSILLQGGVFDYMEFTRTLKHGAKEKEDENQPQVFTLVHIFMVY